MSVQINEHARMSDYHGDYQQWLAEQVSLLRAGRYAELDVAHLLEELEDMGASNRRALSSHLIILLAHLLKWQYQPVHRCSSWRGSIVEQRVQIEDLLELAPSLTSTISELSERAYPKALKIATRETGLERGMFPTSLPYSAQQLLDDDFWPD